MAKDKPLFLFSLLRPAFLGVVMALALCIVYWPGLDGPYVLDDGENILHNPAVAMTEISRDTIRTALWGNDSGPLKRPLASLSFALNHYFNSGFHPNLAFKTTNLAIHLVNVCLVYLFVHMLLGVPRLAGTLDGIRRRRIAFYTAAIWAFHPLHLTSILYVVQRMNSLSALGVLAGLTLFLHGRMVLGNNVTKGLGLMTGGTVGGMALGLASKENAVLLPVFALTIEYCFFRFQTPSGRSARPLMAFYAVAILLPAVAATAYLVHKPDLIVDSYITRHFTMFERVLTETRVLWTYVGLILLPVNSHFSLFHDDIALSTSLLAPATTLFAVTGVLAALGLALARAGRHPVLSFSILWFLGGHALESGILGLELAYEHRNYLPSLGIMFALVYGLVFAIGKTPRVSRTALAAMLLVLGFVTWNRAGVWNNIQTLAMHTVKTHPDSPRANDFAARVSLSFGRDMVSAINYTLRGARLAPEEVGFRTDLLILLNGLGAEIGQDILKRTQRKDDDSFAVHITGLDEAIRAERTKAGIRLFHESTRPEVIAELLATKAITVHGIVSLENLRRCILDAPKTCAALRDTALSWFVLAGENPRTSHDYHAVLAGNAARLYADKENIVSALGYIERAVAFMPDRLSYQFARAEYLIRLGRLEEAGHVIDFIASAPIPPETPALLHKSNIGKLREMHDRAVGESRRQQTRSG